MPIDTPYPATPVEFARQVAEERRRTEAVTLERNTALDALAKAAEEIAALRQEVNDVRKVMEVALEAAARRLPAEPTEAMVAAGASVLFWGDEPPVAGAEPPTDFHPMARTTWVAMVAAHEAEMSGADPA